MPKRVKPQTIEHWRDGESIQKLELTSKMVERLPDGTCRVSFPPGQILLNTGDELHFDIDGLAEWLAEVRTCRKGS